MSFGGLIMLLEIVGMLSGSLGGPEILYFMGGVLDGIGFVFFLGGFAIREEYSQKRKMV